MILEGLLTTCNADGSPNVAPMGATVDDSGREVGDRLELRPFHGTTTLANLQRTGQAVFHVTDDVEQLARAAIHRFDSPPEMLPAEGVEGHVLAGACRWYALQLVELDGSGSRAWATMDVVARGRLRDFFGFNRAKHAVLEAAILATRVGLLPADEIRRQLSQLAPLVEKTAGCQELAAMDLLRNHLDATLNLQK